MVENTKRIKFQLDDTKMSPKSKKSTYIADNINFNKNLYKSIVDFFMEEGMNFSNCNKSSNFENSNLMYSLGLSKEAKITDKAFYKLLKQLNLDQNFDNFFEVTSLISKYRKLNQQNNLIYIKRNKSNENKNYKKTFKFSDLKRNLKRSRSFNSIYNFQRLNTIDLNTC